MTDKTTSDNDWNRELIIRPIGYVKSSLKDPSLVADREGLTTGGNHGHLRRQALDIKKTVSQIVVNPALDGILDGLADFSHALILYWPHLAPSESRALIQIHPMGRKDLNKVGVFASCSPARPNPILATVVKVIGVNANILTVQGLEAVDQSPVVDIKPYNRHYFQVEDVKLADWMERIEQEMET